MKVIISHDVDHLHWKEHWKDHFIPALAWRTVKAVAKKQLSIRNALLRLKPGRLHRVPELHTFNKANDIPSTYFFGMRKGLNLSYHYQSAQPLISFLLEDGATVGVHGMAYEDIKAMKEERSRYTQLTGSTPVGIRNHYLRKEKNTLHLMEKLGYLFDSTHNYIGAPFKQGNIWEFPISVMDVDVISFYDRNVDSARQKTIARLNEARQKRLPFFVVNFHDLYFSEGYPVHREWYFWLIEFLKEEGMMFTNFTEAIKWMEAAEHSRYA